jgi:tetratricopeptide (TPR) repeat protein
MKTRLRTFAKVVLLASIASCGQLECDQQKQDSMEANNRGVQKSKAGSQQDAIKDFEMALTLDATNHEAAWNLGQLYMNQANSKCMSDKTTADCLALWDKAAKAFEQAAKNSPDDAMYHFRLGQALYEGGKYDLAHGSLDKAVSLNKKLYKAHYFLGQIHLVQGRPKEAAIEWSESARLNPSFGKPFYSLGKLYYAWDYYDQSVKVLEAGAATANDGQMRADINYQLGLSYDGLQQWDKAIEAYQKSIADDPGNIDAKLQLGMTYAAKGDKANGKKYLDEYIKSVGQANDANSFKLMAANARMLKLMSED